MICFSYAAEEAVCNLLLKGNVMAIFGPQSDSSAEHIKSITDSKEIPFIDTRYYQIIIVIFIILNNIEF